MGQPREGQRSSGFTGDDDFGPAPDEFGQAAQTVTADVAALVSGRSEWDEPTRTSDVVGSLAAHEATLFRERQSRALTIPPYESDGTTVQMPMPPDAMAQDSLPAPVTPARVVSLPRHGAPVLGSVPLARVTLTRVPSPAPPPRPVEVAPVAYEPEQPMVAGVIDTPPTPEKTTRIFGRWTWIAVGSALALAVAIAAGIQRERLWRLAEAARGFNQSAAAGSAPVVPRAIAP